MEIDVDIQNVEDFVLSDDFRDFLISNTTDFATAAFVLQILLDKIEEIKNLDGNDAYDFPNWECVGKWEINPDGYYPQCPFCGREPVDGELNIRCGYCGARLERC
jgi:hypothetical protein